MPAILRRNIFPALKLLQTPSPVAAIASVASSTELLHTLLPIVHSFSPISQSSVLTPAVLVLTDLEVRSVTVTLISVILLQFSLKHL